MKVREGYYSEKIRNESWDYVLNYLSEMQRKVFEAIKKIEPCSNEQIAQHLGVYPHTITPRVLELRQLGLVEFAKEGYCQRSKRKVSLWKIYKEKPKPPEQFNIEF